MSTISKFLSAFALAVVAGVIATPAHALEFEYTYPAEHEIESRQILPDHELNAPVTTYYQGQENGQASSLDAVIHFASGKDKPSAVSEHHLRKIAHMLKSPTYKGAHVTVNGYSDSSGKPATNERLSYHRALNVMHALVADGVPAGTLSAQGLGAENPVATNSTPEGRAQNRRVTFTVTYPAAQ